MKYICRFLKLRIRRFVVAKQSEDVLWSIVGYLGRYTYSDLDTGETKEIRSCRYCTWHLTDLSYEETHQLSHHADDCIFVQAMKVLESIGYELIEPESKK